MASDEPDSYDDSEEFDLARTEIENFKEMRGHVRDGKVFHLTSPASAGVMDAIQSYDPVGDTAIAIVCRDGGRATTTSVKLAGFVPDRSYEVTFADDPRVVVMTGAQLNDPGISVRLPESQDGEIVYVRPVGSSTPLHIPKPNRVNVVE